jgi:hypothetical protein
VYDKSDDKESYIIINGIDFDERAQSHTIKVDTTVSGITDAEKFESVPYYYGNDYGESIYQKNADKQTINYVNDKFNAEVNDINFGTIEYSERNKVYHRQDDDNLPNNTVNISDQRRDKKAMKVLVSQSAPLGNGMTLRYYQNGSYTNLSDSDILIKNLIKIIFLRLVGIGMTVSYFISEIQYQRRAIIKPNCVGLLKIVFKVL